MGEGGYADLPPALQTAAVGNADGGALVPSPPLTGGGTHATIDPDAFYLVLGAQTVIAALQANAHSIPVFCDIPIPCVLNANNTSDPPSALAPTSLQSEIPHLAFVAALPFRGLRDAILRSLPYIDYEDLWRDSVSGGYFIWGKTPWMPQGWEVTEQWAAKWWYLLDQDIVETANFWRLQRGLAKLELRRPELPSTRPPDDA